MLNTIYTANVVNYSKPYEPRDIMSMSDGDIIVDTFRCLDWWLDLHSKRQDIVSFRWSEKLILANSALLLARGIDPALATKL